jgi:hypothetical protein
VFDHGQMLDVAIRRLDGSTAVDLGTRTAPPLPVAPALAPILPDGLRRGSTVSVTGSVSLLLALLGAASAGGAWCALVGFPLISAEAAHEYGIDLARLAIVPSPGVGGFTAQQGSWTTAIGALLDAVDVVAARPPRVVPGDVRRLAARARSRDAVLMPFYPHAGGTREQRSDQQSSDQHWPGADVRLRARDGQWSGIGAGGGRLQARQLEVTAEGRGTAARPRAARLWLPAAGGGVDSVGAGNSVGAPPVAPVELAG